MYPPARTEIHHQAPSLPAKLVSATLTLTPQSSAESDATMNSQMPTTPTTTGPQSAHRRGLNSPSRSSRTVLPQPDLATGAGAAFKTSIDEVLAFVRAHNSYIPPLDEKPVDGQLAKFDNIERYGISDKQEDRLWVLEAERLLRAVSDFDENLRFESPLPQWGIDKTEFESLSKLGLQAVNCLNICRRELWHRGVVSRDPLTRPTRRQ